MDFEIECEGADCKGAYGTKKMTVEIAGADLAELIEAVGVNAILEEIGEEKVSEHFDLRPADD